MADPGVLIAAVISSAGAPAQLLLSAAFGNFDLMISPGLLEEFERVLNRPKFHKYLKGTNPKDYVALLKWVGNLVPDPSEVEHGLTPDPGDDYLVALARGAKANYLVSGDPHLTELKDPRPPVVTPRAFLEILSRDEY